VDDLPAPTNCTAPRAMTTAAAEDVPVAVERACSEDRICQTVWPIIVRGHCAGGETKGGSVRGGSLGIWLVVLGDAAEDDECTDGQPQEANNIVVHQKQLARHVVRVAEAARRDPPLAFILFDLARLMPAIR